MADTTNVKMGGPSPEQVAFDLMKLIADAEGRGFAHGYTGCVSRDWILSTYAQCRSVVISGWKAPEILNDRPLVE